MWLRAGRLIRLALLLLELSCVGWVESREMALDFRIDRTAEGGGRRGAMTLPHGVVETPVFMPVGTVASVKAVEQGVLEGLGRGRRGGADYSGEYLSSVSAAGA